MATTFGQSEGSGAGLPRKVNIPSGIVNANLLSKTSLASDCFIRQQFSNKLQAYLVGYVNSIYSNYPVFK
jgi:hypothetical protein